MYKSSVLWNGGTSKIRLLHSYEVLWIPNIDAIYRSYCISQGKEVTAWKIWFISSSVSAHHKVCRSLNRCSRHDNTLNKLLSWETEGES